MPKYVDIDETIKDLKYALESARYSYLDPDECDKQIVAIEKAIEHLESCEEADVQEVVHSKYIIDHDYIICNHCGYEIHDPYGDLIQEYDYCPKCGAKKDIEKWI